jgi:hypothetical protein
MYTIAEYDYGHQSSLMSYTVYKNLRFTGAGGLIVTKRSRAIELFGG